MADLTRLPRGDDLGGGDALDGGADPNGRGGVGESGDVDQGTGVERPRAGDRWSTRSMALVLLAVNTPILVATVRALARGWQPLGDNGILLVRARDVATSHHPLLGTWSSASTVYGEQMNNPGPLYFDALAVPVRVLGPWVGLAVGVMLVNIAAASLAVVVARRTGGTPAMVAVGLVVAGLQWVMGSELLFDPWQPNALVLPMFAFLVLAAGLATGDLTLLPWFAGLASLLVQTHLSHAPAVAALTVAVAVMGGLALRSAGGQVRWRRPLAWTAVVVVIAWIQPVVEQLDGGGGNLGRLAGASQGGADVPTYGAGLAVRLVAEVSVLGPWWSRTSFDEAVPLTPADQPVPGLVGLAPAAVALALVVLGLVAAAVAWWRAGRRELAAPAVVAIVAITAGTVGLALSPINVVGIAVHQMRWLWPIAGMATAALLMALFYPVRARPTWTQRTALAGVVLTLGVALAALPTRNALSGPVAQASDLPAAQALVSGLEALEGRGTVLFDGRGLWFNEPYSGLVFAEMQDRGIPFVFDDEGFIRQFGEERRNDGQARLRLWQVEGPAVREVPPGAERIAFVEHTPRPIALFVEPIG